VILPDANVLLYAQDGTSPHHEKARRWWDGLLSGRMPVCLCWPVLTAFVRIATSARTYERPVSLADATASVDPWLRQPCVQVVGPTHAHRHAFRGLLEAAGASSNLVTDAHMAALAIEHGCRLASTDSDFARFAGLSWFDPLQT
jgi:toxin-antitoxin system PIN domain toxin